jgi:hypothetical protein
MIYSANLRFSKEVLPQTLSDIDLKTFLFWASPQKIKEEVKIGWYLHLL